MKNNTRIAPSPTGDMHLGTARTAYFNYLAARSSGGEFTLRIDDTDASRNKQEHVDVILETMEWLGLDYDRLVYQSESNLYNIYADQLVKDGMAEVLENGAIALTPDSDRFIPSTWNDTIAGDITVSDKEKSIISRSILIKGDGTPAYNFATAADDLGMVTNRVIRGHDHINNTAKQLTFMNAMIASYILAGIPDYEAFSEIPTYTHVGLIHVNKKKLSKRDGAASMLKYRADGYSPDAILNFMLRLGWSETSGNTIKKITKDMAIDIFLNEGKMRNQSSNMDLALLDSMQRKYKKS
jgi:glutamyl-tRNA synthetase|tara:strand:+ start:1615 stop:2505 length:891 start_codon:yes stop_codon:yes gene_type:complete